MIVLEVLSVWFNQIFYIFSGPSLSVARRGCGAAVWGSKLVVAGGSDGQHSLRSVEILTIGGTWEPGPPMREKRAGVSLATLNDRLYAVGGFSGTF